MLCFYPDYHLELRNYGDELDSAREVILRRILGIRLNLSCLFELESSLAAKAFQMRFGNAFFI